MTEAQSEGKGSRSDLGASLAARTLDRPWIALVLFAAFTVILTFPLAFQLRSHIPLGAGDIWQNLWNVWWWRTALFELGISPYHTDYLFHPLGISLAVHTHSPLNMLATLPVSLTLGVDAAYNTALLLGFLLAGFHTYLLVRYLTGEPRAALFAGLLFAFTPMHFEQSLEHLNIASVQFIPLFVLFVLRLCREGGWRNAVGAGLSLAANALVAWYYGLIAVFVGTALVVRELAGRRHQTVTRLAPELGLAAVIAAGFVLPFAWPLLSTISFDETVRAAHMGIDPTFWFVPSDHHPLFGGLSVEFHRAFRRVPAVGFLAYLGYVPLGLAAAAVSGRKWGGDRRFFWGAMALTFLVLALGRSLRVLGDDLMPLPHALFAHLPVLDRLRVANRFQLWAFLPLAVLAGHSLATLFRGRRPWLAWGLGALIVVEYLWLPYPLQPAPRHPAVEALANDAYLGAVLPIPLPIAAPSAEALYDQTRHGRPIVGGYVSYNPPERLNVIRSDPFLFAVAMGRVPTRGPDVARLRNLGVHEIIVHVDQALPTVPPRGDYYEWRAATMSRRVPPQVVASIRLLLREALGPPVRTDDSIEVYRVPR